MLKHEQIWAAIDLLASRHGLSASGLARRAGLDPTTFNKSKRLTPDARQRWPSTESIAKILMATGETLDSFVGMVTNSAVSTPQILPLISAGDAANPDSFDASGQPHGDVWDDFTLGVFADDKAFAFEVDSNAVSPLYREGQVLIAVPGSAIRRGDRALIRMKSGELLVGQVKRASATSHELEHCGAEDVSHTCQQGDIQWIARIHWVSQ